MSAQLEFPLYESLSVDGKIEWIKSIQEGHVESQDKVRKKLFKRLDEVQKENAELRGILRELLLVLDRPAQ